MRKNVNILGAAVITIGAVVMFGTAGASDCQTIDISTAALNCTIGLVIIAGGALLRRIGGMI